MRFIFAYLFFSQLAFASDYLWVENKGYPFRLKLESHANQVICFGKVKNMITRLIHTAACSSLSPDSCPDPKECKKSTSYNFKNLSETQVSFKRKSFFSLKISSTTYIYFEEKVDELSNLVYTIGLDLNNLTNEVSSLSGSEFDYLLRLFKQPLQSFKKIDSVKCLNGIWMDDDDDKKCLKCEHPDRCLNSEINLFERYIEGKRKSEYFLVANLLK